MTGSDHAAAVSPAASKTIVGLAMLAMAGLSGAAERDPDVLAALLPAGDLSLTVLYRYEHVEDAALSPGGPRLHDADASTIRVALRYLTPEWHGFTAGAEVEHVDELGPNDFNNGSNGKTDFATVADPEGTEFNEAFVRYAGLKNAELKLGRQAITYRDAPLHRFIGTILWRQNWQTFDAFAVGLKPLQDLAVRYAYVWNVNRIFGDDAREPLSNFDSDSHLVNIQFGRYARLKLEAYAYLLDLGNAAAFSTRTFGLRGAGSQPLSGQLSLLYAAEYAHQGDYADNPAHIDADYYLLQGGIKVVPASILDTFIVKVSREVLSGRGGADRFVTILGTNHAFQGTADRFLVTPGDGIEDSYLDVVATIKRLKLVASYHMFESDRDGYDYGNEVDLLAEYRISKRTRVAVKYADYNADRNALNRLRNPAQSADKSIFWAYLALKLD